MSTAIQRKAASDRMIRAAEAQRAGIRRAAMMGDVAEENRRKRALRLILTKTARVDTDALQATASALRLSADARTRGTKDWLAVMCVGPEPFLSDAQIRAAMVLRDHMNAVHGGTSAVMQERVDGGAMGNGQMEGLCDRRKATRYAMNAALDAPEDQAAVPGAFCVILHGRSLRYGCVMSGISPGKGMARIKTAICEALDAAAAHLEIAR